MSGAREWLMFWRTDYVQNTLIEVPPLLPTGKANDGRAGQLLAEDRQNLALREFVC